MHSCFLEARHRRMPGLPHHALPVGHEGHIAVCKPNLSTRTLGFALLIPFTGANDDAWGSGQGWIHVYCKDKVYLPWGVGKLWAMMMPNHAHTLDNVGPSSHEVYSKTCRFSFFLQNIILCFKQKKLAGSHHQDLKHLSPVCTNLFQSWRIQILTWKLLWNLHCMQSDGALVKKLRMQPRGIHCKGQTSDLMRVAGCVLQKVKSIIWLLVEISGW